MEEPKKKKLVKRDEAILFPTREKHHRRENKSDRVRVLRVFAPISLFFDGDSCLFKSLRDSLATHMKKKNKKIERRFR